MNRRTLLKALAAAPIAARSARSAPSKANIVIMLADDLGHGDLGVTGCTDIATPSIDSLAADGTRFVHAYSNGPVCSPTRAALLTGRYQQRAGIDHVIYANEKKRGMTLKARLIPEALREAGYVSALIGKWHLGYPKKYFPTRQGFDEFFGFVSGNIDYFAHTDRLDVPDLWHRERALDDPRYMTELIGDESIRFIDRHLEQPFFLYVPFNAPHSPYQGPGDRHTAGNQEITRKVNRTRAVYKKMVEAMDRNVGRILDHLAKRGLEETTAVFFMSDNGGVRGVARNDPFRGYKGSLWEGGIRTPLLARWKGQFQAGSTTTQMAAGMDLFPTALEIAGLGVPKKQRLDGVSLLPVAKGWDRLTHDTLYFHYYPPGVKRPWKAIVRDGWKYLADNSGAEYLFHLREDIGEQRDLSSKLPERAVRMRLDYEVWRTAVFKGAPREPRTRP